ncbi:MAG: helix-hairpin-helix domain-containing protein [Candidatus Pedobacter colombiensis]|uniref:Helix-hairpin-helix domain-containing protein n=1 Tax=Candidatus Pedobacter colombiensis TaxID=3121371 RepID=A0AAJ6B6J9_9SPHI|nr:helix-hairpin-helix domain-containing protein [Pedobacter sp.]WEK20072.1 MAG: helix-hairpin-helix domain-containing protein [Pedobacter sp.]
MKKWLAVYFGFTKREFNGLMTLVVLIGLIMSFPYIYGLIKQEEQVTEGEVQAVLELALLEKKKLNNRKEHHAEPRTVKRRASLFTFDPNTISVAEWVKLGLSAKQAEAILKYRVKGGKFRKHSDLRKMYTISEQMYERLEPYIRIGNDLESSLVLTAKVYTKRVPIKSAPVIIEVNGADTTELDQIKGIGMTFANRIIKYRERIGGFYKKEQLMEVFGLDSVKYEEIKDQVVIDVSKLKKINVNTAELADFKNHPYIRYKQVNALIQYRKQHGNYSNIADLNKVAILNQETINRLAAYLEF